MNTGLEIQQGIDTYCLFTPLTNKSKNAIFNALEKLPEFRTHKKDYYLDQYRYTSNYFEENGIKLDIQRYSAIGWSLKVRLKPSIILKAEHPWALYQPTNKNYRTLVNRADRILKTVGVPCSINEMSICRLDVTENLIFKKKELVQIYLNLLKKSLIPAKYRLDYFQKTNPKVKDVQEANRCSYKILCKSAAFFAYDKTAQLQMIGRIQAPTGGKKILRLEVQMERPAIKKQVGEQVNNYQYLKSCAQQGSEILSWYIDRLQPKCEQYIHYQAAVDMVEKNITNKRTKEWMLYLLRKVSDSRDLSSAMDKLKDEFVLKRHQCERILKRFAKLGINPITLPSTVSLDTLPNLITVLNTTDE